MDFRLAFVYTDWSFWTLIILWLVEWSSHLYYYNIFVLLMSMAGCRYSSLLKPLTLNTTSIKSQDVLGWILYLVLWSLHDTLRISGHQQFTNSFQHLLNMSIVTVLHEHLVRFVMHPNDLLMTNGILNLNKYWWLGI